jgi:hypothetical protein
MRSPLALTADVRQDRCDNEGGDTFQPISLMCTRTRNSRRLLVLNDEYFVFFILVRCRPIPSIGATDGSSLDHGDAVRPANPYSQILEIDGPDAVYVVRTTRLNSALKFRPGAVAQFAVDGKHLKIKFDREETNRQGELRVHHESGETASWR